MHQYIQFALFGLGAGALYALSSQGLIVIYRGSGVLNFAQGAIGVAGAYVCWDLNANYDVSFWVALVLGILLSAAIGALMHLVVMRPLRTASPLARIVATLGVLTTVQAIILLRYGSDEKFPTSHLPNGAWHPSGILIIKDRVWLLVIAAAISIALWAVFRYSRFGLGTTAVAQNQRWAAALGWSPDLIATINWSLGAGLAGLAAILVAPLITLQVTVMTSLMVASLAAALVASFTSFPIAFAAGILIGAGQSLVDRYATQPGLGPSLPFIVIVFVMVVRGRSLPLRDFFLQKLPSVGSGVVRPQFLLPTAAIAAVLMFTLPARWVDCLTVTLAIGMLMLSIVVLTGYTGQISLAQYALAGFGAWIAGRLVGDAGVPLWAATIAACAGTAALGILFALPAVRTRGINLAILTLGLGTAIELMIFNNAEYVGKSGGTDVGIADLFGWNIGAFAHPERYGVVTLACFTVVALAISNLRRGRVGRRLIAVRTNERAAAALGISVFSAKVYAFGLAAGIAAFAGVLIAFRSTVILYSDFSNMYSLTYLGYAFIGGIGYVVGPIFGGTFAPGAFGMVLGDTVIHGMARYMLLIGGITIIVLVIVHRDGIAKDQVHLARKLFRLKAPVSRDVFAREARVEPARVEPATLTVDHLAVRFGGTVAVDDVSLTIRAGAILGLIGPNGAGKTTLIDAVTGFVSPASATIMLDGVDISNRSPTQRARLGVSRSFQSLELFEDSTVLDNLRAAADPRDARSFLTDLVYPSTPPLPAQVRVAIEHFGLMDALDAKVADLPYGRRRLVAIARAMATQPRVLLLDEPASGLSDRETAEFARLVRSLADDWGIAILVVEHDMNFVMPICDSIVVIDFGQKIAEGTPEEIRNDPKVIAAYLGEVDEEVALELASETMA